MASEVFDRPPVDPGTPRSRALALLAALLLGGVLLVVQNAGPVANIFEPGPTADELGEQAAAEVAPPSPAEPFTLSARFAVQAQNAHPIIAGEPEATMRTLDAWALSPADRVRAAVVAGELLSADRAIERLESLREPLAGTPLRPDVEDLLAVYTEGPDALGEDDADRLRAHHGFFGEVALTHGLDDTDPRRAPLVTGGARLFALLSVIGLGLLVVGVLGFVAFIAAIVLLSMRKLKSGLGPVEAGGSVFLEAFALFAGGFLLLMVGLEPISRVVQDETWMTVIQVCAQWMLLVCPLWPLIRGMKWDAFSRAIGWHRGRGVFREIGAGIVGYLAGLPLLALGIGITLGLVALVTVFRLAAGLGEPPPPDNPLFDLATSNNPVILLLFFGLATVWAPVCEEAIFRGALYRHLRGRAGIVVSAIASAFIFGLCHAYGPILVFPVVMLGVTFALMREWRGSLIAPMTAHALHNATVSIMAYSVLRMIS
jgi:membrane protease YdiL (CAAX protease family)